MKVQVAVLGSPSNGSYGFCGRKATLNHAYALVSVCPCSGKGVGWGGEGQIILKTPLQLKLPGQTAQAGCESRINRI